MTQFSTKKKNRYFLILYIDFNQPHLDQTVLYQIRANLQCQHRCISPTTFCTRVQLTDSWVQQSTQTLTKLYSCLLNEGFLTLISVWGHCVNVQSMISSDKLSGSSLGNDRNSSQSAVKGVQHGGLYTVWQLWW